MKKPKNATAFILENEKWQDILSLLREVALSKGLGETIKWNFPVYTHKGKNIVGLGAFKDYAGIWFFQGATLKDEARHLFNAQEGKTQAMRQWRFASIEEVDVNLVKAYIEEAIQNQESGNITKPSPASKKSLLIPDELQTVLKENADLKLCFEQFSLSKKREFSEYIQQAKRQETKDKRLKKVIPMILANVGLNDKYRK